MGKNSILILYRIGIVKNRINPGCSKIEINLQGGKFTEILRSLNCQIFHWYTTWVAIVPFGGIFIHFSAEISGYSRRNLEVLIRLIEVFAQRSVILLKEGH